MINMEDRHLRIVLDILKKYPYTFYAFGSRTRKNTKKLSDLDLCFFEKIPENIKLKIDEDFEESDLPYKIDIIDWHKCDQDFRNLIFKDMVCLQASSNLRKIENNAFGHFKYLPKKLQLKVIQDQHLTIINSGLGSSMFNIVCATNLPSTIDLDKKINQVIAEFNGQNFAWWLGPTSSSIILGNKLLQHGFVIESTEQAMIYDLADFNISDQVVFSSANLIINQVTSLKQLEDFITILEKYDNSVRSFYQKLPESLLCKQEQLFVGYEDDIPVIIAVLYNENDMAGIFSLLTSEDKRRLGYGTQMMNSLVARAKKDGINYVCLSSSNDSANKMYERLGFKDIGRFECFEWKI